MDAREGNDLVPRDGGFNAQLLPGSDPERSSTSKSSLFRDAISLEEHRKKAEKLCAPPALSQMQTAGARSTRASAPLRVTGRARTLQSRKPNEKIKNRRAGVRDMSRRVVFTVESKPPLSEIHAAERHSIRKHGRANGRQKIREPGVVPHGRTVYR